MYCPKYFAPSSTLFTTVADDGPMSISTSPALPINFPSIEVIYISFIGYSVIASPIYCTDEGFTKDSLNMITVPIVDPTTGATAYGLRECDSPSFRIMRTHLLVLFMIKLSPCIIIFPSISIGVLDSLGAISTIS